jgi:thiol-disulfide isomerase/thioredoxin
MQTEPTPPSPAAPPSRGLARTLVSGAVIALAVAAVVHLGVEEARRVRLVHGGKPAPAFTLERFGGGTVSLEGLQGKVVMLDFWATWCPPCRAEMPALTRLAKEYESKGLVFVAANQDDPETQKVEVGLFVDTLPALGPSVAFADGALGDAYRIEVLPTMYFIGRKGEILDAYTSYASEGTLRNRIERALAEAK